MTYIRPRFQPQNPALSGYSLGWSSCTAFSAAMAAAFDVQKQYVMSGAQVRQMTHDTVGGLTLAQVDAALLEGWNINLNTTYRLPWTEFAKAINSGKAGILQGYYAPIADSRFDAGRGFRGNHAVTVLPDWIAMDPLADGRATGVYRYHAEPYPQALLRDFAGRLNLSTTGYSALGQGYVYASLTRDRVANYTLSIRAGTYGVYNVVNGVIQPPGARVARTGGFSASCTPPRLYPWPGHTSQSLVQITTGSHAGQYVRSTWAREA